MRVLLIGGSGQLGSEIVRRWTDCSIVAPPHAEVPLGNRDALERSIEQHAPEMIVNCAAFHNVDLCEDEPEHAFAANAVAVDQLAGLAQDRGIRFVTISTDYVFSGDATVPYTEDDPPAPISVYGTSKLAGELLVQRREMDALVVRTCGVYGVRPSATKGYTFVDRIIAQARAGDRIRVVHDVVASPSYAGHLAEGLHRLVGAHSRGLFHLVNQGAVSWYDFACAALAAAEIEYAIEPVPQSTWTTKARRPQYSALASVRLNDVMPDWRAGIQTYLKDKAATLSLQ